MRINKKIYYNQALNDMKKYCKKTSKKIGKGFIKYGDEKDFLPIKNIYLDILGHIKKLRKKNG